MAWSRERIAVAAYFAVLGVICATWASSIDDMKLLLGLNEAEQGWLLFSGPIGNLAKEVGTSVSRIADTMSNALCNIVTIMLGLSVGSKLACEKFLSGTTLGILALGLVAFCVGTAAGVIMAKIMNLFSKEKVNPLIGSAGVSAVPMAARVSNKVSLQNDPTNFILMQAMGPNVSGVIGSAVVAGILYTLCR